MPLEIGLAFFLHRRCYLILELTMVPRHALFALVLPCLILPGNAHAEGPLSTPGDIAWVAISAALVFFMQAGFALLEGGGSRAKNSVNVIMKNYADLCVGALAFWAVGFALMFGANPSGWVGTTGLTFEGSPPCSAMVSRSPARSTSAVWPRMSWQTTRAGNHGKSRSRLRYISCLSESFSMAGSHLRTKFSANTRDV